MNNFEAGAPEQPPAADDALLLIAEQELSDTLRLVRALPALRHRFSRVTLLCQPTLQVLLQQSLGSSVEFIAGSPDWVQERLSASWKWQVPLSSVSGVVGQTTPALPEGVPYLFAQAARVRVWGERFAHWEADHGGRKLRVGLACPEPVQQQQLAPLLARGDVHWVCLQHPAPELRAAHAQQQPLPWIDECQDLAEAAALLANLDLIIGTDTALTHLAGAMGRPVWLLSRIEAARPWLGRRPDTPWYPTMRVFNQIRRADLTDAVERVGLALEDRLFDRAQVDTPNAMRALRAGAAQYAAGRLAQAEEACRLALKLAPDGVGAYAQLIAVLREQGRSVEAQAACRQALCLQPGHSTACVNLAQLLREQGQDHLAEVYARQAQPIAAQSSPAVASDAGALRQRRAAQLAAKTASAATVEFVCATRMSRQDFWQYSPLGLSLQRLRGSDRPAPFIVFENTRGLAEVYDERLRSSDSAELLAFVQDDVWIDDFFAAERLVQALQVYSVVGVAGNQRCSPTHVSWDCVNENLERDQAQYLSGHIAYGEGPLGPITHYGSAPKDCELLDGVLLAVRKSALLAAGVSFDRRFASHFYELDFCRAARAAGLRLGTWPITLTRRSVDADVGSNAWQEGLRLYRQKHGQREANQLAH